MALVHCSLPEDIVVEIIFQSQCVANGGSFSYCHESFVALGKSHFLLFLLLLILLVLCKLGISTNLRYYIIVEARPN
jgi:hypothetical protein